TCTRAPLPQLAAYSAGASGTSSSRPTRSPPTARDLQLPVEVRDALRQLYPLPRPRPEGPAGLQLLANLGVLLLQHLLALLSALADVPGRRAAAEQPVPEGVQVRRA